MNRTRFLPFATAIVVSLAAVCVAPQIAAQQAVAKSPALTTAKPESVGFSAERLARLHAAIQQEIEKKKTMAGAVTLLARHGKIVDLQAYGKKDLASGAPMTTDTIFRVFSMTKPVTGVAMMILYEEGKWRPGDPISQYIPEFAHLKVFKGVDANGKTIVEDPIHPPTMQELMTHTAGFTYGLFGDGPVDKAYQSAGVMSSKNLQEMINKLVNIPLLYQPGTKWVYSVSMDVQGYIIEKLSGQSLPDFMRDRIFAPLKMKDTGFYVPPDKWNRFATLYAENNRGELTPLPPIAGAGLGDYKSQPTMPSGGGGMVSTAQDYARFAQMLLNGGELDGVRILSPATVQLMTSNHLAPSLMTGEFSIGPETIRPGMGWGYDCAVFNDPPIANEIVGKGTFFWLGAADTWFWVDPTNDLVFVGMTQHQIGPNQPNVEQISRPTVYQALVDPKR
ncbi:MAG TPA: serine hydrolase domain-containing protein [Candidatus Acidoferrum sp.]|nr:serine hydrolase domain-containing protein [Candidatus Acidoferrum sp.]